MNLPNNDRGLAPFDAGKDSCGVGFVAHIKNQKSHEIVLQGLTILEKLAHRGACGCEENTGDGAGILLQIPDKFLRKCAKASGFELPQAGEYGCGSVFLPKDAAEAAQIRKI